MRYHPSWSEVPRNRFEQIVEAHGGWPAWDRLTSIEFRLKKMSGILVVAKGLHRTFFVPNKVVVLPKQRRVDFVFSEHTDTFENGKIKFSRAGKVIENGRTAFRKSTFEQWHPEHAAYFFGYAWANYLSYPFILPQFELLNFRVAADTSIFDIKFPETFHTHSQNQRFYFGQNQLLFRHDYRAVVAGPLVYGAHYTLDYVRHQDIQLSFIRRVRPRIGPIVFPFYGIYGEIEF